MDEAGISAQDEISHLSNPLRSLLLVVGMVFVAIAPGMANPQQKSWQNVRDDFLHGDPELMQFHCERGAVANQLGLSAFNDAWVKKTQALRFEAGVAKAPPEGSKLFFTGLSAAIASRCPDVW